MIQRWFILSFALLVSCSPRPYLPGIGDPRWGVDITWHGHSCFTLEDSVERTLVIDPFDETVGYGRLELRTDALLITHNHFDHNYKKAVRARHTDVELLESTGTITVAGEVPVVGLDSFHDNEQGEVNGHNAIMIFTLGGIRFAHLGDYHQSRLTDEQLRYLQDLDVLFIPVGGVTTLNAQEAKKVIDQLKPKAIFPMHYGNIRFYRLDEVDAFAKLFPPEQVHQLETSHIRLKISDLTDRPNVYILQSVSKNY